MTAVRAVRISRTKATVVWTLPSHAVQSVAVSSARKSMSLQSGVHFTLFDNSKSVSRPDKAVCTTGDGFSLLMELTFLQETGHKDDFLTK